MKTVKRIATIILAGYMLLAMGGLSVFYHYCTCTNTVIASLMVEDSCCDSTPSEPGCCGATDTNSCHTQSENDCDCDTDVKVFRVDDATTTINNSVIVQDINLLGAVEYLFSRMILASEQKITVVLPTYIPPPIAGKELVIAIHSFKIPEIVS